MTARFFILLLPKDINEEEARLLRDFYNFLLLPIDDDKEESGRQAVPI
jgi:hypothetical protein